MSAHWLRCGPRGRSNTLCETLEEGNKEAKVNTLADLLYNAYTLADLKGEAFFNGIAEWLVKVNVKELAKELASWMPRR